MNPPDMETGVAPLGEPLRGCYTDSFAYKTLKDRIPIIVARIVDSLVVRRSQIMSDPGSTVTSEDLKEVIERLSGLRYEITTNKPFKPLEDNHEDAQAWNAHLLNESEESKWFHATWMTAETYAYRRIFEAFQLTSSFKDFDYFLHFKSQQIQSSTSNMEGCHKVLSSKDLCSPDHLQTFLKLSLWGNQCDLSISSGQINTESLNLHSLVSEKDLFLLINDGPYVEKYLKSQSNDGRIDIVLDNSGFELFTDLYLADCLISSHLASRIIFHVKSLPWFISDVTKKDFPVMFDLLRVSLPDLIQRWEAHLENGKWSISENTFWTLPHCFNNLKSVDPNLYSQLESSKLVVFKGDLNYRKVVGDRNWDPSTSFKDSLDGGLGSLTLLCLRTLKADTVVGLSPGQAESTRKKDTDWMINGKWGLISFNEG